MFIRSQSRRTLINTECIYINNDIDIHCISYRKEFHLGTYKSHERALEVLDMIQDAFEDGMSCHEKSLIDEDGTTQSWKRHYIFEMPEE